MPPDAAGAAPCRQAVVVSALGIFQILAWGSSYYLLAVLAAPIARDTGWPLAWIVGALSLGLLVEGLVAPLVGQDRQPLLGVGAFGVLGQGVAIRGLGLGEVAALLQRPTEGDLDVGRLPPGDPGRRSRVEDVDRFMIPAPPAGLDAPGRGDHSEYQKTE